MCTILYYWFLLYVKSGIFSIKKNQKKNLRLSKLYRSKNFRRKKKFIFNIPLDLQTLHDECYSIYYSIKKTELAILIKKLCFTYTLL